MHSPVRRAAAAVTVLLVLLAAHPGGGRAHDQAADPGEKVFRSKGNCASCHGVAARGTPIGPDLTDDVWVQFPSRPTPADVESLVRAGVQRPARYPVPMPPMGGSRLSDSEVADVALYVLTLGQENDSASGAGGR